MAKFFLIAGLVVALGSVQTVGNLIGVLLMGASIFFLDKSEV